MKKILFVDDEPNVLGGLRRMLRGLRRDWDMVFVESGREALSRLAAASFDVVVTDMRMPGLDGVQLLHEVADLHPSAVRIILSGQCERSAVLKGVGLAHQFITKPCDSETLKSTVARACVLRDRIPDEWIRQAISSVQSLPSQPSAYSELIEELTSASARNERIAEIVSRDPAMTGKTLQMVSSGFFGTPQRVSDIRQAVGLLGLDTIRALVEFTDSFAPLKRDDVQDEKFWNMFADHCLSVAAAAKGIARAESNDGTLIGNAQLAGMLHDVAVVAIAKDSPETYVDALSLARLDQIVLAEAEMRTFSASRDSMGAYLMGLWGLPDPIVNAIAHHLSPIRSSDGTFGVLAAVHVANAVVEEEIADWIGVPSPIDMDFLERIGCADRLDTWREICQSTKSEGVLP